MKCACPNNVEEVEVESSSWSLLSDFAGFASEARRLDVNIKPSHSTFSTTVSTQNFKMSDSEERETKPFKFVTGMTCLCS